MGLVGSHLQAPRDETIALITDASLTYAMLSSKRVVAIQPVKTSPTLPCSALLSHSKQGKHLRLSNQGSRHFFEERSVAKPVQTGSAERQR